MVHVIVRILRWLQIEKSMVHVIVRILRWLQIEKSMVHVIVRILRWLQNNYLIKLRFILFFDSSTAPGRVRHSSIPFSNIN